MVPVRVTAMASSTTDWLRGVTSAEARLTVSTLSSNPGGGAGVSIPGAYKY